MMRVKTDDNIVACPLGDGLALFDIRTGSYFSLNRSGAVMWQAASKPVDLTELVAAVAHTFATTREQVEADVERTLHDLIAANLLVTIEPVTDGPGSMSQMG